MAGLGRWRKRAAVESERAGTVLPERRPDDVRRRQCRTGLCRRKGSRAVCWALSNELELVGASELRRFAGRAAVPDVEERGRGSGGADGDGRGAELVDGAAAPCPVSSVDASAAGRTGPEA